MTDRIALPVPRPMESETDTKVIEQESSSRRRPVRLAEPLAVGQAVGRYELVHRLGNGGMAAVYLGRATGRAGFEKLVAVKVIHPHLAAEPEFVEMFLDEARIAARLHHPHIVEIHDLGEDDGVLYMVMEYVEGETLAAMLRQLRKQGERLPLSCVLQIMADTCKGLAAAHDLTHPDGRPMHLVHRDVSPHNLLVSMDGRVKVVDFGIAKASGRRSSTRTGQLRGKLAYMSPEQARGESIDHRTDLFAAGAVLWELLTNERLFVAETESETLARVTACEIPDIREHRSDLPQGVVELLEHALSVDRDRRFESAQEMLREVRAQLRGLDGDTEPREDLAAEMNRLFAGRIRYIRAAVRRASESGPRPEVAANDPLSPEDTTRAAEHRDVAERSDPAPSRSTGPLPSVAAAPGVVTGTQTLTASLATAPARHWSLWLLLPLVGAVVGAAIVSGRFGSSEDRPTAQQAVREADERPSLASSGQDPALPRAVAATSVEGQFDIVPAGATIMLDGVAHPLPSPTTIDVPRSESAIEVTIAKAGYETRVLELAPLGAYRFDQRLEPLPAVSETSEAEEPEPPRGGTWLKARTKKAKTKPDAGQPDAAATDPPTKDGDDERRPAPMPDFESFFDAKKGDDEKGDDEKPDPGEASGS